MRVIAVLLLIAGLSLNPLFTAQAAASVTGQTSSSSMPTSFTTKTAAGGNEIGGENRASLDHIRILQWIMVILFILAAAGGLLFLYGLAIADNQMLARWGGLLMVSSIPLAFVCYGIALILK